MFKSYKKGDLVKHNNDNTTGIVLDSRKKERSQSKSKHVIELIVGTVVDIMWNTGKVETNVRVEDISLVSRSK